MVLNRITQELDRIAAGLRGEPPTPGEWRALAKRVEIAISHGGDLEDLLQEWILDMGVFEDGYDVEDLAYELRRVTDVNLDVRKLQETLGQYLVVRGA